MQPEANERIWFSKIPAAWFPCRREQWFLLRFLDQLLESLDTAVNGDLVCIALVTEGDFQDFSLQVTGADDYTDGNTQQVCIGEHEAGTDLAVVVNDFHTGGLEILVELIGKGTDLGIICTHGAQVDLPRGDGHGPNGAVLVVMGLTDGSGQTAYTDAVAAHNGMLLIAFGSQVGHVHGLGVLGAQLEDITDLDTTGDGNGGLAAMGADAAFYDLGEVMVGELTQVTGNIQTGIVMVCLIAAADQVVQTLQGGVVENSNLVGNTLGADKAGTEAAVFGDDGRVDVVAQEVGELGLVGIQVATDKENNIVIVGIPLIDNGLAGLICGDL